MPTKQCLVDVLLNRLVDLCVNNVRYRDRLRVNMLILAESSQVGSHQSLFDVYHLKAASLNSPGAFYHKQLYFTRDAPSPPLLYPRDRPLLIAPARDSEGLTSSRDGIEAAPLAGCVRPDAIITNPEVSSVAIPIHHRENVSASKTSLSIEDVKLYQFDPASSALSRRARTFFAPPMSDRRSELHHADSAPALAC